VIHALNSFTASYSLGRGSDSFAAAPSDVIIVFLAALASSLLLGVLPAMFIFHNREKWAARWFPEYSETGSIHSDELYAVGYGLLGIYFAILGLKSTVLAIVNLFAVEYLASMAWGPAGAAIVELAAATLLISNARERARRSAA
jgi:hypothetical protein